MSGFIEETKCVMCGGYALYMYDRKWGEVHEGTECQNYDCGFQHYIENGVVRTGYMSKQDIKELNFETSSYDDAHELLTDLIEENYCKYPLTSVGISYDKENDKEMVNQKIEELWTASEFPHHQFETWVELFKWHSGQKCFKDTPVPDGRFKVYRGGDEELGFSWTIDKEQAEWFVNRHHLMGDEHSFLREMLIKREDVLFYTDERGEKEIVLRDAS